MMVTVPASLVPETKWDGDLVLTGPARSFVLASTHPLRSAPCLLCRQPILGRLATVIGVADLTAPDGTADGLSGDMFIAHSAHFPVPAPQLQAAIHRRLNTGNTHGIVS